ncbi:MoaD/ThiS family protein [Homoserinibacter sp. GY 40078]|uniref:MoaD/ThiS family protein n=1 Tax=Homoserinibacter sp. GY 40078 TaxID=2603275 RepID=UPI0011CA9B88|nr:MoaD/ThiS family protein [Homoserinibacter sp. GY 40078]TXK18567.1 MoaD/ThiS family protein [Homoserinibacter sp. GY 40078]
MAEVELRYFAAAAEAAGRDTERVETDAATVGALATLVAERYGPAMARIIEKGSLLSDGIVVRDTGRPLGARLDVLPPFTGG